MLPLENGWFSFPLKIETVYIFLDVDFYLLQQSNYILSEIHTVAEPEEQHRQLPGEELPLPPIDGGYLN